MTAAAIGGMVMDTVKPIVQEGSKSFFGALGNLMNEKYEKRKATYTADLLKQQTILKNELDIRLNNAQTENDIKKAYYEYDNKLKLLNQQFENDMRILDKELAQKNKELQRKYDIQDVNIEKLEKYREFLQQQIYTAPNPETRQALTNQLTSTYANQAYGGTGPKLPANLIEKKYIFKPNPELQKISDRYFTELGLVNAMEAPNPNSKIIKSGRRYNE